jgi:diguanylate cyclase (GGDEF)-like protein
MARSARRTLPRPGMHVSFRNRLTFFFLVLVALPVVAVAIAGYAVVRNNERAQTDERLSQAQEAAAALYDDAAEGARAVADGLRGSAALAAAVQDGDRRALRRLAAATARREGLARVELRVPGTGRVAAGSAAAVAPARRALRDADGEPAGELALSVTTAREYARLVADVTGLEVLVSRGGDVVAATVPVASVEELPARGAADVGGTGYRLTTMAEPGFGGREVQVRLLADAGETDDAVSGSALILLGVLIALVASAAAFALTAARSLGAQTQRLLVAAQRLGRGDFAVDVPTEGNDEFAALGREFNAMARQLKARMDDLQAERSRLQEIVRRVGDSIGKGLDRDALLGIVVQTAVDGVGADSGRVLMRDGPGGEPAEAARAGNVSAHLQVMRAAEASALHGGEPAEAEYSGAHALARPLTAQDGDRIVLGVIAIARPGRAFSPHEQELFAYLANQAAISIENVDLHKTVQRQAVTDELTGLFNHRRFQEVMTAEVERTKRFGQDLGLIMLDLDNFKQVNDEYGHLQGDLVLREVARVLRESSREIDEPARYGGEEMAVALPQTGLQGAYEFAERVRRRIEDLELPLLDGSGTLRVTASFGAAALPRSADIDKDALVAAADAALYRAKRAGKNRTVKAE